MNSPLWRLVDVTVPGRRGPRLDRVSLEIPAGITAILGASGAGKTTLLNLLVGFERPSQGQVVALHESVERPSPGRTTALPTGRLPVFWSPPGHGLWPHLTVAAHLTALLAGPSAECQQRADQLLQAFDLRGVHHAYPGTLSQGERDRLSLARVLASGAHVVVLDEPLIHVQPQKGRDYWAFLRTWCHDTETSIVLATHDCSTFLSDVNFAVCLDHGRVVSAGTPDEL